MKPHKFSYSPKSKPTIEFALLILPLTAQGQTQNPQSISLVVVAVLAIFLMLSLLTVREYIRYRGAYRELNNMVQQKSEEKVRSQEFMSSTVGEQAVLDELERKKIDHLPDEQLFPTPLSNSKDDFTAKDRYVERPTGASRVRDGARINNLTPSPSDASIFPDSSASPVFHLSPDAFDPWFADLANPIERYLEKKGLRQLLRQRPNRLQWLDIIKTLHDNHTNNAVTRVIQLVSGNEDFGDIDQFNGHDLCDDLTVGLESLFDDVDIQVIGDTQSELSGNATEIRQLLLSLMLGAIVSQRRSAISKPIRLQMSDQGNKCYISMHSYATGLKPEEMAEQINNSKNQNAAYELLRRFIYKFGAHNVIVNTNPLKGTKITLLIPTVS